MFNSSIFHKFATWEKDDENDYNKTNSLFLKNAKMLSFEAYVLRISGKNECEIPKIQDKRLQVFGKRENVKEKYIKEKKEI